MEDPAKQAPSLCARDAKQNCIHSRASSALFQEHNASLLAPEEDGPTPAQEARSRPLSAYDVADEPVYGRVNETSSEETSSEDDWVTGGNQEKQKTIKSFNKSKTNVQLVVDPNEEKYDNNVEISVDDYADLPTKWQIHAKENGGKYNFSSYAAEEFQKHKKGMLKTMDISEVCAFQQNKLSKPLRKKVPPELAKECTQSFKNIAGWMGDVKSKKKPLEHVEKLLRQAFRLGDECRDEFYCQIMKQCNNNPKSVSLKRGFQLFSVFTGTFPPSESLAPYVADFLHNVAEGGGPNAELAQHALERFDQTMVVGARKGIPTQKELNCIVERKLVSLRILFRDRKLQQVLVRSQTKCETVVNMLAGALKLERPESYSLYQVEECPEGMMQKQIAHWRKKHKNKDPTKADLTEMLNEMPISRAIPFQERILDIVSQNHEIEKRTKKKVELLFAPKVFGQSQEKDFGAQDWRLHFAEANKIVVNGFANINAKQAFDLAAVQVACEHGAQPTEYFTNGLLVKELHRYLPWGVLEKEKAPLAAEVKILTKHAAYSKFSESDGYREYCRQLKELSPTFYGCSFYPVVLVSRVRQEVSQALTVAISEKGLVLLNRDTWEIESMYKLEEILSYGFRKESFLFVGGHLLKQRRYNFLSKQAKEMNDLLLAYINLKVAEQQAKGY